MNREKLDQIALDAAIEQAERSWQQGGIPIGAALVNDQGAIIAAGHNERVQRDDPTAHGEMSCLRHAGRRTDWHTLTLATTLSPCSMCSGAIVLYQIPRVVIGERQTFQGREDWLRESGVQIACLNDQRCIDLMQLLIEQKPRLWDEDIGLPDPASH